MRPQPLSPHTAAETSEACHFVHQHAALLIKTHTTARGPTAGSSAGFEFPSVSGRPVLSLSGCGSGEVSLLRLLSPPSPEADW